MTNYMIISRKRIMRLFGNYENLETLKEHNNNK